MTRRHVTFDCEGSLCVGTLDEAPGSNGLLIVSGGNELRSGAWNGQALLAARLAATGIAVFRFDRRGVGDSEGANGGFRSSTADIGAALAAFRSEAPQITRVFAFGNCDGASALMLSQGMGCDVLVLSNPWTIESDGEEAPPPAAVRAHYAQRLRDPRALLRMLTGKVSLSGLFASLRSALKPSPPPSSLAQEVAAGLARFNGPVTILLAGRDRTAQVFEAGWNKTDPRVQRCPGATHSYVESQDWLFDQVVGATKG
jgi:exosortase A-associated hydrolase 1